VAGERRSMFQRLKAGWAEKFVSSGPRDIGERKADRGRNQRGETGRRWGRTRHKRGKGEVRGVISRGKMQRSRHLEKTEGR